MDPLQSNGHGGHQEVVEGGVGVLFIAFQISKIIGLELMNLSLQLAALPLTQGFALASPYFGRLNQHFNKEYRRQGIHYQPSPEPRHLDVGQHQLSFRIIHGQAQ